MRPLATELATRLTQVNAAKQRWLVVEKQGKQYLYATYKFKSFKRTWDFLNGVATCAHTQRHHPEIFTVYNRVDLWLTTHDQGDVVTEKDFDLAEGANDVISKLP